MGGELGQWSEWNHESELEWHLLNYPRHYGLKRWIGDLNHLYRSSPALHDLDFDPSGFEWIDCNDSEQSVLSMLRKGLGQEDLTAVVFNFTPVPRPGYRIGVPRAGVWSEALNSDAAEYGGSGMGNFGRVVAMPEPWHGRRYSLRITVPPLAAVFLRFNREG
jgi:1,4-alpha-glucan branching enzyme